MTILVFGGSSQIGHFLLARLLERGESIISLSRQPRSPVAGVTWLHGQLPDQVPALPALSAIVSFGPLQPFADWLAATPLEGAPRVIATSSMSAETKRDSALPAERELAEDLNHRLVQRAIAAQGTCTGEHGIGLHKQGFLVDETGEGAVAMMRAIKQALDPDNILNPGKIFQL